MSPEKCANCSDDRRDGYAELVRREAEWHLEDEQLERKAAENLLYAAERMTITSIADLSVGG